MFGLFKKYFVPHPENDHQPHILRVEAILVMLAAVFVVETLFLAHILVLGRSGLLAAIATNVLIDRTNDARLAEGLPALTVSPLLARAATMKAEDMAKNGYFAHTSPQGTTPWHWFDEAGYRYFRAGENLAVNFVESNDVVTAWMNSPKHRENIENGKYTEIGVGTARGTYQGKEATFIVQLFGLPRVESMGLPVAVATAETVGSAAPAPVPQPVAIPSESAKPAIVPPSPAEVAGIETPTDNTIVVSGIAEVETQIPPSKMGEVKRYAKLLERLASSPKTLAQTFYLALATLVALALAFVFFLRAHVPHPRIVKHGIIFLIFVGAIVLLNQYVALASASVL